MARRPSTVSWIPVRILFAFLLLSALIRAQHPQAVTDCSNCHVDQATGLQELDVLHGFNCNWCHTDFNFGRTFLGPLGTWNQQCSACHNPQVIQTRNLPTPTKGHRCIVCHGQQMPIGNPTELHEKHTESTNCVVCHGFIPDTGTAIGSGNRAVCTTCHDSSVLTTGLREIHEEMTDEGVSCLECHGGVRPPVDTVAGPPVGNATIVCDICHQNANPAAFLSRGPELHQQHADKGLDCGSCHADAELQDDREPMPAVDDPRRARVDRNGFNECSHCHQGTPSASLEQIHQKHAEEGQWCFNCHVGSDLRPVGQTAPVTTPAESCQLCHTSRTYGDDFPFRVHEEHADEGLKCYSCHQATPPLFGWTDRWQRSPGTFVEYGSGCQSSAGTTPQIGHTGLPLVGRSFDVTLRDAPPSAPAVVAIAAESTVVDLTPDGMPGCVGLVIPLAISLSATNGAGTSAFTQAVPQSRVLIGQAFYFQWFALDPPANATGLISSNGGRATVGR